MSDSSASQSLESFGNEVIAIFGKEYWPHPNENDLRKILEIKSSRGFSDFLRSRDYEHLVWEQISISWTRMFKWKEQKTTFVLEAVTGGDLYICGLYFGFAGSLKYINILLSVVTSTIFLERKGDFRGWVRSENYKLHSLLSHCRWCLSKLGDRHRKNCGNFVSRKNKRFEPAQEELRKDIERASGDLASRFYIPPTLFRLLWR